MMPWDKPMVTEQRTGADWLAAPHKGEYILPKTIQPEIRFTGELQKIRPEPGDVFVLKVPKPISAEEAGRIKDLLSKELGGAKVLILGDGLDIDCIAQPKQSTITVNIDPGAVREQPWKEIRSVSLGSMIGGAVGGQVEVTQEIPIRPLESMWQRYQGSVKSSTGLQTQPASSVKFGDPVPQTFGKPRTEGL